MIVISTSSRDEDIAHSYQLGCNAYVVKPESASTFIEVIHAVSNYWLGVDLLSTTEREGASPCKTPRSECCSSKTISAMRCS